ncbi:MAG TPA: ABC transporter substrate-binding protein [Acidimicrobiia bacterium]|jgi:ABC-type branched-subunit amino acid transport system substrate-binding protein|nr:ABC transporter substrate-binding protein [Acidimicrobiia bacterium]
MRIKPKWLAILLALGMLLAACSPSGEGGDDTTTTGGGTDTTQPSTDTTEAPTDTTGGGGGDIATDIGVDTEAGTITLGLLSDLSGPFSSLVQVIVTGHEVYWENVNANGGIGGMTVELETVDTAYDVPTHVQRYEELKDEVVAFAHSTGSPHTVAINPQLQSDGILAIPLTWYSGWSDTAINANLMHHGVPYCLESMNVIGYLAENQDISTIAIASMAGDYGLDSHAGARLAAEAAGLEIVYEGEGAINVADEATLTEVANDIVASGADLVYVTTTPTAFSSIFGQALAGGFQAIWSGAGPSYNPAFIAPDSPIKDAIAASTFWSSYYSLWGQDETADAVQLLTDGGVTQPVSAYMEGFVEAQIMHAALQAAYDAGDMTQAGVLAAAKTLENVTFDGLGPDESYVGESNEQVQRASATIWQPDPEGLASGENAGESVLETNYTSSIAEAYEFTTACYQLEG